MAEEIRCYIMRTMTNNRLKLQGRIGILCPAPQARLEKEKLESNKWTTQWAGASRFEIHGPQPKVDVDLDLGTCSCRFWQLTGIPCKHACAAISWKKENPEEYCNGWLGLASYNASYEFFIQPVQGETYWEPTPFTKPVPPKVKKRNSGRPKTKRRRDATEEPVGGKIKRTLPDIQCSRCSLYGHNTNGCRKQGVPLKPNDWISPVVSGEENDGEPVETENHTPDATEIDVTQSQPFFESQEVETQPLTMKFMPTPSLRPPTPNQTVLRPPAPTKP